MPRPGRCRGGREPLGPSRISGYAAALGLRPRRAAARPGILPAQSSHKSAALAPRRASVYVTRMPAPFPSPTSLPQLSQTSTVLRAILPPVGGQFGRLIYSKDHRIGERTRATVVFRQFVLPQRRLGPESGED